jgi:hypothetical protein
MPSAQPAVFIPANQKTLVIYSSVLFKTYSIRFSEPGVEVSWERNSTLPPFHTYGTHNTDQIFGATVAGGYCNFWFTSPMNLYANIT